MSGIGFTRFFRAAGFDTAVLARAATFFFAAFFVVYNLALSFTTAARGALALSTLPLLTMLVAAALGASLGEGYFAIDWTRYHRNFFLALQSQKRPSERDWTHGSRVYLPVKCQEHRLPYMSPMAGENRARFWMSSRSWVRSEDRLVGRWQSLCICPIRRK